MAYFTYPVLERRRQPELGPPHQLSSFSRPSRSQVLIFWGLYWVIRDLLRLPHGLWCKRTHDTELASPHRLPPTRDDGKTEICAPQEIRAPQEPSVCVFERFSSRFKQLQVVPLIFHGLFPHTLRWSETDSPNGAHPINFGVFRAPQEDSISRI